MGDTDRISDILDHVHWTGPVSKMLKGSISRDLDDSKQAEGCYDIEAPRNWMEVLHKHYRPLNIHLGPNGSPSRDENTTSVDLPTNDPARGSQYGNV
jgi:hypothetical protein